MRDSSSFSICRAASFTSCSRALRIDDDDAFDHAGEDRLHARAIARLLAEPAADLLHRVVQRARHGAELVVAEAEVRRRQIAARDSARRRRRSAGTRWPMRDENTQAMAAPPSSATPSAVSVAVSTGCS